MKSVDFLKALGGVVAMVVACNTFAQASDAMASGAMAAPATSAKAVRKVNSQLGRKVRGAIGKAQGVDVSNISVRARGGVVTLTGSVPAQDQIDKAGTAAKGVSGVTSVVNKLTVVQE